MSSELHPLSSCAVGRQRFIQRWGLVGLFGLVVFLHGSLLPHLELQGEEGRRVIAAREMITSGDYVIPTVWGEPYLNKPPLYPWLTVLASNFTGGGVGSTAVRIPALLATLLTGFLLFLTGSRMNRPRTGIFAAVLFLLCPVVIRKSTLGETDLLLTSGVAIYALEMLVITRTPKNRFFSSIWMTTGLCIAFLAKGPSALPFVIGIMLATAKRDGIAVHRDPRWWGPPLLAMGFSSLWALAVTLQLDQMGSSLSAVEIWFGEVSRSGSQDGWWIHRWEFILGVLFGYLPASLLVLFSGPMKSGRGWLGDPRHRSLALSIVIPFIVLLLWPSVQPRYLLPALPLIAWLAASILDSSLAGEFPSRSGEKSVWIFTTAVRGLVVVAGLLAISIEGARWIDSTAFSKIPVLAPLDFMQLASLLLLSASLPFAAIGLVNVARGSIEESSFRWILMLLAWSGCQATVLLPFRGEDRPRQEVAKAIEAVVPSHQQLWHDVSGRWNTLAQVNRSLKIVTAQTGPAPGDWFLTMETSPQQLQEGGQTIEFSDGSIAFIGVIDDEKR